MSKLSEQNKIILATAISGVLMIVMMAFSMSISDGLAFGFVSYPLVKLFTGKGKEVSKPMWFISLLFCGYLIAKVWI